jgi:hypothetical protein
MLQAKERTPTPFSIFFTFGLAFEFFKEFGGASISMLGIVHFQMNTFV